MTAVEDLELELRLFFRRAQSSGSTLAQLIHPELDASAFPLLAHIMEKPGTRGSDLAAHFGVGRATISRQLSRLDELGMIHREVDPEDSRGQLITLTEDGLARLTAARNARVAALGAALKDWTTDDIETLAHLLHRYAASFAAWRVHHPELTV